MIEHDIAALIAADGNGVLGTTLRIAMMPETPDTVVTVYGGSGSMGVSFFSEQSPAMEWHRVQVKVRSADHETGRMLMERIYQQLAARGGFTVNATRYADLSPVQPPYPLGQDGNQRWIWGVNFQALKDRSPLS